MGDGDMDTDKRVDSDGFSLGSDSDADDPPVSRGGSGADAGDFGQRQTGGAAPALPSLGLGGAAGSSVSAATPLTARKPPGLGLNLGGGGDAPSSRSAEPSHPDAVAPGTMPRMSLSDHRPVGLNLSALRDRAKEDDESDKSELQIRREKFAHFEKHCTEIVPGIYVSGEGVAKNRATLDEHGITHVINCVGFVIPNYFEPDLVYKTMWLQDTPDEDISPVLYDCFDFIEEAAVTSNGRVLVHCSQGVSRSCSVVISYLMWRDGGTYEDTFAAVKERRGIANPNMGFTCQMLQWVKRVGAETETEAPPHRLYRVAPHSEHDPTYLVAKPCISCDTSQLDARGAYVLATSARRAFVWVGNSLASNEYKSVAERFARQLFKYDGLGPADSRVATVAGGEEPAEVLEALGLDAAATRDGVNGWAVQRIAELDDDFAMYAKGERSEIAANSGAAVPAPEWARALTKAGGAGRGLAGNPTLTKGWSLKEPATGTGPSSGQPHSPESPGTVAGNLARSLSLPPSRDDTTSPSLGIGGLGLDARGVGGAGTSRGDQGTNGGDHDSGRSESEPMDTERTDSSGRPTLHEWPSLVEYDMYDGDDLVSSGVLLLRKGRNVFVWIGSGVVLDGSDKFVSGGRIGEEAAARLAIEGGARVTVEAEGGESGEFWEAFESGEA